MNILVEGIGSMVFNTQLKYYKEMGWNITGIDIDNKSSGLYMVDKPYIVPRYSEKKSFEFIEKIISREKIDLVFPTINEGLLDWSWRKKMLLEKYGTKVIISDDKVIEICSDKWNTYNFFVENNIPTPRTSLNSQYELIKPRVGRGSAGIFIKDNIKQDVDMKGNISQEIVKGEEYTIDILCDFNSNPIYIIPRIRAGVELGVSIKGITVYDKGIIEYCIKIIKALKPMGIINIQCFKNENEIKFIEINPRIAGGSSLSFAASDNWFKAINCFVSNQQYNKKQVDYNKYMFRTYVDIIVDKKELIKDGE